MSDAKLAYRVVLLDVGDTLIGPRQSYGAVYAGVMADLGVERPVEQFEQALHTTWREFDARIPPGVDRYRTFEGGEAEYWTRFADHTLHTLLDGEATPELTARVLPALRDAFTCPDSWRIYDEVPSTLAALREAGARLCVVSNWDSRLPGLLDTLGMIDLFDELVVSHIEGVEKPDPELFRIALARLGARREDAIHVGDRADMDLAGARAAGIDALIVDRRGRYPGEPWAVADLTDLPRIVRNGLDRSS